MAFITLLQWVVLTRKHAKVVVKDITVFPMFQQHCKASHLIEFVSSIYMDPMFSSWVTYFSSTCKHSNILLISSLGWVLTIQLTLYVLWLCRGSHYQSFGGIVHLWEFSIISCFFLSFHKMQLSLILTI